MILLDILIPMKMMNDTELKYWLALIWAPKLTWPALSELLVDGRTVPDLFDSPDANLQTLGLKPETVAYLRAPNWRAVEQHLAWAQQDEHTIICLTDTSYPSHLKEIHDPPLVLFVRGQADILTTRQIAIVGSREPSPSGRSLALQFSQTLSESGLTITSGLAHGIDTASHEGALAGSGQTIAVMGTGLDQVYPRRNQKLADDILIKGAWISEFPLGTPPKPAHFPQRNRIVTGLSEGTLVVEATLKSGSLISARLAMEHNREVFAIPGSIHNPPSAGCHFLIKNGAKLTESVQDVLDELPEIDISAATSPSENKSRLGLDVDHRNLLECVGFEATPLDTILVRSSNNMSDVATKLLNLQLEGLICSVPGGYARVCT